MDYHRIYREFIADRKTREADLTGYSERHHILPRALGGLDDADNLIRLTAEDHLFAHLLLAKVHGGRLWAALLVMLKPARQLGVVSRGKRARRIVGVAKREQSRRQTGVARPDVSAKLKGLPKSDEAKARMSVAAKGRKVSPETRARMSAALVGRRWSEVAKAKLAAKRRGDANPAKRPEVRAKISAEAKRRVAGSGNPRFDHTVRHFRHEDGRTERLTKFEMCAKHGLNRTCLNYVINGDRPATKGWTVVT